MVLYGARRCLMYELGFVVPKILLSLRYDVPDICNTFSCYINHQVLKKKINFFDKNNTQNYI